MSRATALAAKTTATIWPSPSEDKYGRKAYGTPYTVKCTFDANDGTTFADGMGIKYTPSFVIWHEFNESLRQVREGDFIARGDQTGIAKPVDADGALPVKSSERSDCSLLGQPDDIRILA
jgi:hypothetical protein